MQIERRPFILIEVFLAIALVSLVVIPITSYPYKIYAKEVAALEALELIRLEELLLKNFLEDLPTHISEEFLINKELTINLSPIFLNLSPLFTATYEAEMHVAIDKTVETKNKQLYLLLKCTLSLSSPTRAQLKRDPIETFVCLSLPLKKE